MYVYSFECVCVQKCNSSVSLHLNFITSIFTVHVYFPNGLNHLGNLTSSLEVDGRGAELKLDATLEFRLRDDDVDGLFSLLDVAPNASAAVCLMPL